jgi:methylenetetrahydrofolate dehydrogenase (NADP+)/methenyltetrahydrofolate cyclohydrolase
MRGQIFGILVQMPLTKQMDSKKILDAVHPEKDVDGFHPINVGHLVAGRPALVACTPSGVMEILRRGGIAIEGANAVVMGRSNIVSKPGALAQRPRRHDLSLENEKSAGSCAAPVSSWPP